MSDDLRFRTASREDADVVLALLSALGDGPPPEHEQVERFFAHLARYPDYRVWLVATGDGPPIGTCSLLVLDNLAHGGAPVGVVENVAVASTQRGHGIGRALMDHAAAYAAAAGCYKLMLSSNLQREEAHAFYQRLGYRLHGYSLSLDLPRETVR